MLLIACPHCGLRNSSEFRHGGESRPRPNPATTTPEEWRTALYIRDNVAGWVRESWFHTYGCRRYIPLERNTLTGEIAGPGGPPDAPGRSAGDAVVDTTVATQGSPA